MDLEAAFDETDVVVIDMGSGITKVGFSGEDAPRETFSTVVKPGLIIDRLNAEAFSPEFLANAELIASCGIKVASLADCVEAPINNSIRGVTEEFSRDGNQVPLFRPADIDGWWMDLSSAPRISSAFEQRHAKARVCSGDIVLAIAGTIGAAAGVPVGVRRGAINGSSARVKPRIGWGGYLLAYLKCSIGRRALTRLAVGSVQKHLNLEDLPGLPVVSPEDGALANIGDKVRRAEQHRRRAAALSDAAQKLVEALIQGEVSESELSEAREALEHGDPSVDRSILSRLGVTSGESLPSADSARNGN